MRRPAKYGRSAGDILVYVLLSVIVISAVVVLTPQFIRALPDIYNEFEVSTRNRPIATGVLTASVVVSMVLGIATTNEARQENRKMGWEVDGKLLHVITMCLESINIATGFLFILLFVYIGFLSVTRYFLNDPPFPNNVMIITYGDVAIALLSWVTLKLKGRIDYERPFGSNSKPSRAQDSRDQLDRTIIGQQVAPRWPLYRRTSRLWIGLAVGIGTFAGVAASLYTPTSSPSRLQTGLALLSSIIFGVAAALQWPTHRR